MHVSDKLKSRLSLIFLVQNLHMLVWIKSSQIHSDFIVNNCQNCRLFYFGLMLLIVSSVADRKYFCKLRSFGLCRELHCRIKNEAGYHFTLTG